MFSKSPNHSFFLFFRINLFLGFFFLVNTSLVMGQQKPRVIICSDIGGTDPDDFQSLNDYIITDADVDPKYQDIFKENDIKLIISD